MAYCYFMTPLLLISLLPSSAGRTKRLDRPQKGPRASACPRLVHPVGLLARLFVGHARRSVCLPSITLMYRRTGGRTDGRMISSEPAAVPRKSNHAGTLARGFSACAPPVQTHLCVREEETSAEL